MPAEKITLETAFFSKPYILIMNMYSILTKSLQYYKSYHQNHSKTLQSPSTRVVRTTTRERTAPIQTLPPPSPAGAAA